MGSIIRPLLFAAPLLLAAPVHAQQTQAQTPGFQLPPASTAPAPNPDQQGPELNVYRDPVTPRSTPPVVAPPAVTPTVTPTTTTTVQPTPQPDRPRAAPAETRVDRNADRATPALTRSTPTPPADAPTATPATGSENASTPAAPPPLPAANAANEAQPIPAPAAVAEKGSALPWIIGGALALIVLVAAFLLRRRSIKPPVDEVAEPDVIATAVDTQAPPPAHPPAPEPVPTLQTPVATPAVTTDRPWLDLDMAIAQARYSLMGVTISYRLILHNRGDRPAQDVLVRGLLGNGGAQQQAMLQSFFTGQDGLPIHSAVSIAPGETIQMPGELRLSPDQIVPVDMGQRSLLIPLAAFDVAYRWGAEADEPVGHGRTARAFIVGQEQEPPADRLAPLRLDQGPRQYRRPAARAAAELTPA